VPVGEWHQLDVSGTASGRLMPPYLHCLHLSTAGLLSAKINRGTGDCSGFLFSMAAAVQCIT
jgi:hypothetical protein